MNFKKFLATAGLLALAFTTPVAGQILSAEIPFGFSTADQTFLPGRYTLTVDVPGNRLVVTDQNGVAMAGLFMSKVYAPALRSRPELVFHKYGETYFLKQIRTQATDISMPVQKAESFAKRAANGSRGPKLALVRISVQ
jgi:hypothetical protein